MDKGIPEANKAIKILIPPLWIFHRDGNHLWLLY